jgi:hypothetical protein
MREFSGSQYCSSEVSTPIPSATITATPMLRSFAATTAAKALAISEVIAPISIPRVGPDMMPAAPASRPLTPQTPSATLFGLVPDSEVSASLLTTARTFRPTSVNFMTTVPASTTAMRNA